MNGPVTPEFVPPVSVDRFERGDIEAAEFTHEAHVYVAWQYLGRLALPEAIARYSAGLKALTRRLGVEQKYHETITWFFMIEVAERIARGKDQDWPAFRSGNADLFDDAGGLIARHYSSERLSSPLARHQFVLPDRMLNTTVA